MKYKKLTEQQLIISIDRLTRFKATEDKYLRVFKDIILSNLISPSIKKTELNSMDYNELTELAQTIFNSSLPDSDGDYTINLRLKEAESLVFCNSDKVQVLLENKLNYKSALKLRKFSHPINLRWLSLISKNLPLEAIRDKYSTRFPISKVILAEGITEEILLPKFGRLLDYDFDKNGIWVIGAGGKNQVVKTYYKLIEELKIPIFILLDNDASANRAQIEPKLRPIDKIHLISSGEFEDLLPQSLILKTINYELKNFATITNTEFNPELPAVANLIEIFRLKGLHEFKKADFAQKVEENLFDDSDISDEIRLIFNELSGNNCLYSAHNNPKQPFYKLSKIDR